MEKWLELEIKAALPVYKKFQAISRHFAAGSYCYFKYGGGIKASFDTFARKPDKLHYIKLAKRIENARVDPETFIVSNFLEHGKVWVGKLSNDAATRIAVRFSGMLEDPAQTLIDDIREHLVDRCIDDDVKFRSMLYTDNPMVLPEFVDSYVRKDVSMHSLIILNRLLNFKPRLDRELADNFVWTDISSEMAKRDGFYKFDIGTAKQKFAHYIKEHW